MHSARVGSGDCVHTIDRRTRSDRDGRALRIDEFFESVAPALLERNGDLAVAGLAALGGPSLAVSVGEESWTLGAHGGALAVRPGVGDASMHLRMDAEQFSAFAHGQLTLNAMWVGGTLDRTGGRHRDVGTWDAVWLAVLEGWPVISDDVSFVDRHGAPMNLDRSFGPSDTGEDVAHFLREAGFVHLTGWIDRAVIDEIAADVDAAGATYERGDGRSWWARTADGTDRCVRLQHFVEVSAATRALLQSRTWDAVRTTLAASDDVVQLPVEGNCIEALVKPIGVVEGISDVPWHRDCNFGRHAYQCCRMTVGISLTDSDTTSGLLRVVAGSHRIGMPAGVAAHDPYLPVIDLPTSKGDLTVHLSCTLHEAQPPTERERKVMYTNFELAPRPGIDDSDDAAHISAIRERVHLEISQQPTTGHAKEGVRS